MLTLHSWWSNPSNHRYFRCHKWNIIWNEYCESCSRGLGSSTSCPWLAAGSWSGQSTWKSRFRTLHLGGIGRLHMLWMWYLAMCTKTLFSPSFNFFFFFFLLLSLISAKDISRCGRLHFCNPNSWTCDWHFSGLWSDSVVLGRREKERERNRMREVVCLLLRLLLCKL